jgi:hypothetical protein
MNISKKFLTIAYVVCLSLIAMATLISITVGKRPSVVLLSLIIVPGTIGYIRLMKKKRIE